MKHLKLLLLCYIVVVVNGQQRNRDQSIPNAGNGGATTRSHPIYQRIEPQRNQRNVSHYAAPNNFNNNNNNNNNAGVPDLNNDLLNRINDRITSLITLDEQQIKRLEALEYKLTRSEVTVQERIDNMRNEINSISRKIGALDDAIHRYDMEEFKNDFDSMRQLIESQRNTQCRQSQQAITSQQSGSFSPSSSSTSVGGSETEEVLDGISTTVTSTRLALHRMESQLVSMSTNISALRSATKDIHQLQRLMPTKQFLNNAIYGLKSQPIYAFLQNGMPGQSRDGGIALNTVASCDDVQSADSGVYSIQINGVKEPFYVYCDLETDADKWTVILNRFDGSVNFFRNWLEYKNGFGNINGEFWMGLDKLHEITTSKLHELLIVLEDFEGVKKTARYSTFAISGEREDYSLNVLGKYYGDAGDSLTYHAGQKFSTFDTDNDAWPEGNCAQSHSGGWWYNSCDMSNLNGKYLFGETDETLRYQGVYWNDFKGTNYSLKSAKMMIRPLN